jgi:hypothetical protein
MLLGAMAPAQAAIGNDPGALQLSPASGPVTTTPSWSTSDACPTGFQGSAIVAAAGAGDVSGVDNVAAGPTLTGGQLASSMAQIKSAGVAV